MHSRYLPVTFLQITHETWFRIVPKVVPLRWRNNGLDSVPNHQPHDCLPNRSFGHRSKKTSKLCVTGLCVENSPVTGEFPAQMASHAETVSIWWRHHDCRSCCVVCNSVLCCTAIYRESTVQTSFIACLSFPKKKPGLGPGMPWLENNWSLRCFDLSNESK